MDVKPGNCCRLNELSPLPSKTLLSDLGGGHTHVATKGIEVIRFQVWRRGFFAPLALLTRRTIVSNFSVQPRLDRLQRLIRNNDCCHPDVPRARRVLINSIIAVLICGSLYDIVADREHWPFSQYPMFSGVWRSPTFTWLRLTGVTASGDEFVLDTNDYIEPFDQSRLAKGLKRILDEKRDPGRIQVALGDCLRRYEELRREARHSGPPLIAMRLYELEWTIDRRAANVDHPDWRRFIAETRP
jgi:hypothetical protein